jgi:hypothetical protein
MIVRMRGVCTIIMAITELGCDMNGWKKVLGCTIADAITHELEGSIGWYKGNDAICVIAAIADTWVKGTIVNDFGFLKGKKQVWHATQIGLSLYRPLYIGGYDIAIDVHNGIYLLHNVHINFVLRIFDTRPSPWHVRHCSTGQCIRNHRTAPRSSRHCLLNLG